MRALLIFMLIFTPAIAETLAFVSFGPTFHWNFGQQTEFSGGMELSYWRGGDLPKGLDFGIELQSGVTRLYSEFQIGLALAGIAAGPVVEFSKKGTDFGLQTTGWFGLFLGADYRYRRMAEQNSRSSAAGLWLKLPKVIDGSFFPEPALLTNATNSLATFDRGLK